MSETGTHAPAVATVQTDEPHVRVTRWDFAPGTATGFHTHGYAYVVVPVVGGVLTMVDAEGVAKAVEMKVGESYSRPDGVAHDVINDSDAPVAFVEIEMKRV